MSIDLPKQVKMFLLVGAINAGITYCIFSILIFLGAHHNHAFLASSAFGIILSYLTMGKHVFRNSKSKSFPKFIASYIVVNLINGGCLNALILLGFNEYLSGAIAIAPASLCAYLLNKFYVFRK